MATSPMPPAEIAPAARLPWPAPALLAWLAAWALALVTLRLCAAAGLAPAWAWAAGMALGAAVAWRLRAASAWRRLFVAAGFPASALAGGWFGGVPAWVWLLPLAVLLAAYPLRAWRDAPLFPTPADALDDLPLAVALPAGARLLDAGCGLGHGLQALRRAFPHACIEGVEWSWPLRLAAALRCPWARVRRADLWAADWSGLALVYLFQRPESMARALAKAEAEMPPGSWLVSLDFAVPGRAPTRRLQRPGARAVWLYRVGAVAGPPGPAGSIPGSAGR